MLALLNSTILLTILISTSAIVWIAASVTSLFGICLQWYVWISAFVVYDVWTWFNPDYRDSFKLVRGLVLKVLWKNRDVQTRHLPIHIAAGCLLVHKKQEKDRAEHPFEGYTDINEVFKDDPDAPPWMKSLTNAQEYMKIALAMYAWKYAIYTYIRDRSFFQSFLSLSNLFWTNVRCFLHTPSHCVVEGDFFRRNLAGLLVQSGLQPSDIHYVSFKNNVFAIPFCVCVHSKSQSIVIALRGSLSVGDWLTDFTTTEAGWTTKDEDGIDNNKAHKGMLKTAKYVYCQLAQHGILKKLFENEQYKKYSLVVTGHSLGAGVSALLAYLLREKHDYDVRSYAFSCPGWLVSEELAKKCEDFVLVFGLGDDLVLRAGNNSLDNLVNEADFLLKDEISHLENINSKIWKSVVLLGKMIRKALSLTSTIKEVNMDGAPHKPEFEQLYLPGRIIHIMLKKGICDCEDSFLMRLAQKEDFLEILVMRNMIHDHLQDNVLHAIETVASYKDPKTNGHIKTTEDDSTSYE